MRLLITAAVCLSAYFCAGQDKKIYLIPDSAKGIKISNIVEELRFIPLETNSTSYFNNMADFLITPDRLIFTDNESNSILIFDKQGKFLHKFKKKRYTLGGLQYVASKNAVFFKSSNKNYTIPVKKANQMMQRSGGGDFSKYVNLELLHLNTNENYRVEKLPVSSFALGHIYYMNGVYALEKMRYNQFEKDTILYHLNLIKNNKLVRSYFPFINLPKLAIDYDDIGINIDRTLNDSTFYIHKDFDNTIYKLVNDSLEAVHSFVFPAGNTMPADFFTTKFRNTIDFEAFKNKNEKATKSFFNIIDLKELLFFGANDNKWGHKKFVFNKNSSTIYDLGKATSDSAMYYLPSNIFSRINNYDEHYVYTFISAADILKEKTNLLNRYKNSTVPPELLKVLNSTGKFSNPVIIQLKLKTNITK